LPKLHLVKYSAISVMTDEQLVQKCNLQDPAAQRELYEKFSRKMFGVCLRYGNSKESAEDLLQEGFVKVFTKLSSFKNEGSLEGWIRRVIVNTALDHLRQQKISWSNSEIQEDALVTEQDFGSVDQKELLKLIQKLPDGYRTVFNLYAIEGFNHQEIAKELGINENTSKSQYSRARAQLMLAVNRLYGKEVIDHQK
jgi:RNA polymerase sigma-70 factor (ECF subfamily)